MDALETTPRAGARPGWRWPRLNMVWLLSPLAYPLLYTLPPSVPADFRVLAGMVLIFILPGWLLHILLFPQARIALSLRTTRAFTLSLALVAVLGLLGWFAGGDWRLGAVSPGSPTPLAGRLTMILWAEALLLLVGAVLLVVRTRREADRPPEAASAGPTDPAGPPAADEPTVERVPAALSPLALSETANPVMQRILRKAYRLGDQHKADHPVAPRWATLLVLGAMVLMAGILGLIAGGQQGLVSDSPDHLAGIREMVERDRILPRTTFHIDGDGGAVDARKGFFHVALAALAVLTRVDPARMWNLIPGFLIPLALIVFHTLARRLLRSEGTALFATFLALICHGEVTRGMFPRLAYGSQMGIVLTWATLAMALEYVLHAAAHRRVLWLIAAGGVAAAATHAFAPVLVLFALVAYLVAMLLLRGVRHAALPRVGSALLALLLGCALPLAWRLLFTYGAPNPIHTHRQGVLSIAPSLFVITPLEWGRLLTITGFGGILLSLFLWRRAREDDAVLYMATLSLVPLLVVANPLLVPMIEPYLGYLVARFVMAVPFLMVLAYMARWMGENFLELHSARRVITALVFYVFMVVLLFPRLEAFARSYSTANRELLRERSIQVWDGLMQRLDTEIPRSAVILSDPLTGYCIPALTRHYTVGILHQHSSPADTLAIKRLQACRDVLSPYLGVGEKARLCRRFRVDYVLVNGAHARPRNYFACNVGPELAMAQKAALENEPALFRKYWDLGGEGALFRVRRENLDALAGIVIPGQRRPTGNTTEELTRSILVRELPAGVFPVQADSLAGVTLAGVAMDTTWACQGEQVELTLYWRRCAAPPRFPLRVHIRLDTAAPRDRLWALRVSKPHRLWQQRRAHVAYRHGMTHEPLEGMFGVQHWPHDRLIVDRVVLPIPRFLARGEYAVKVKWEERTFLPNLPVSHYLSDRDAYDGQTVALLEVY